MLSKYDVIFRDMNVSTSLEVKVDSFLQNDLDYISFKHTVRALLYANLKI
jgi:hypothetical protein